MHTVPIKRQFSKLLACLLAAIICLGMAPTPTHAQPQTSTAERCFTETGFCIAGRIREYWEQNGGLPVFGYPIGPQQAELVEGQPFQVQWFERHRLELHPEDPAPYDVLLGRLGAQRFEQIGIKPPTETPREGCQFFADTGYNICGRFLEAWRADGLEFDGRPGKSYNESLALFGLPLSNEQVYQSSDGKTWTSQWFERARFEHHPENKPPYDVLFGLLGSEMPRTQPFRSGAEIVFVSNRDGNSEIYVMNADGSNQQRLTNDPRADSEPIWSPDGTMIAFFRGSDVFVMNADGSNLFAPAVDVDVFGDIEQFAWSPDSRKLVLSRNTTNTDSELVIVELDGSGANVLTSGFGKNTDPAWSPDGSTIAFVSDREKQGERKLYAMNADGSNVRKIADEAPWWTPVWSPNSRVVFFAARDKQPGIYRANSDGSGATSVIAIGESRYAFDPAILRDGTRIAYQVSTSNTQGVPVGGTIWVAGSNGNNPMPLAGTDVTSGTTAKNPTWAPLGTRFAWVQSCFQSRQYDPCLIDNNIFVTDALGANQRQLTQNSGANFAPNWRQR